MSSHATFMGLPPELRLRIYEYALDPFAGKDPSVSHEPEPSGHFREDSPRSNPSRSDRAAANSSLPLLRVNKQVYREALPVLCSGSELRIDLGSMVFDYLDPSRLTRLRHDLGLVSRDASKLMRQLLLRGSHDCGEMCTLPRLNLAEYQDRYWGIVSWLLPNLRNLRIHLRLCECKPGEHKLGLHAFIGVKNLLRLQKLTLQLHYRGLAARTCDDALS
ncbi:Hypothetical predicted protein [Lecanosticta acicola]|uniref:2EXR domain-containing protein n=1 Tax=Lecanosticta acicola TaxID=111012 RepID=A0AAI9EBV8_9PEZI|nr:Hypothetical predicted protein [Lecanosticta acicola]